ncbi:MAG TPA: hypothetical protein VGC41_27720 [Kofleriaceae bacterium]
MSVVDTLLAYEQMMGAAGFLSWSQDKNPSWSDADQREYDALVAKCDAYKPAYDALLARTDAPWLAWVAACRAALEALPDDKRDFAESVMFEHWPSRLYDAVRYLKQHAQIPSVPGVYQRAPEILARYAELDANLAGLSLAEGRAPNVAEVQAETAAAEREQKELLPDVQQILARTDAPWLAFVAACKTAL